ncbi:unnamed protein product [Prorocentrum cordatum]|uniref:Uncharacterized protein n=1 Tax=Prorocentrum cordatum TaxID=2364126 RepID=A0ABN9UC82_9DINO|nr:unnamed protein product [Polarella glacialis]
MPDARASKEPSGCRWSAARPKGLHRTAAPACPGVTRLAAGPAGSAAVAALPRRPPSGIVRWRGKQQTSEREVVFPLKYLADIASAGKKRGGRGGGQGGSGGWSPSSAAPTAMHNQLNDLVQALGRGELSGSQSGMAPAKAPSEAPWAKDAAELNASKAALDPEIGEGEKANVPLQASDSESLQKVPAGEDFEDLRQPLKDKVAQLRDILEGLCNPTSAHRRASHELSMARTEHQQTGDRGSRGQAPTVEFDSLEEFEANYAGLHDFLGSVAWQGMLSSMRVKGKPAAASGGAAGDAKTMSPCVKAPPTWGRRICSRYT